MNILQGCFPPAYPQLIGPRLHAPFTWRLAETLLRRTCPSLSAPRPLNLAILNPASPLAHTGQPPDLANAMSLG